MNTQAAPPGSDALLRRLEWTVLRRLDGLLQGDYRTLWRGVGVDLADLREYQPHDDVRHIDWNVTARLQRPHVRQFTEDRDLSAWFLLDVSGSVDFGSGERTKLALAGGFVATLARVLTRHGSRVGALFYGRRVDAVLPPRATRTQVLELLQRMRARPEPAAPVVPPRKPRRGLFGRRRGQAAAASGAGTVLAELLLAAERIMRRRSLVFVVSDFISQPGWEAVLARLARRHEVVTVRVCDPAELALPDVGLVTIEDAETGEQLFVDAGDAAFRARYAELAQAHEQALRQTLVASGVDTLELATDDDLLQALLRFVELRRLRARQPLPGRFPAHLHSEQAA